MSHTLFILSAIKNPHLQPGGRVYSATLVVGSCVFAVSRDTGSLNERKMFLY